jgi:cytochrome P450
VIADEVWGFLAQGAPAHVMTWCWWLLATHSQSERRLHDELEQLVGRLPAASDLASLPITRGIVLEALRLWPPVWGIDRVALGDYSLGDQRIPRGATVFISPYITHRDERYWSDAKTFDPGRWLNGTAPGIDDYRYLPFGAGQRRCIAREFVLLHCMLTLATLGRHWQPRPVSQRLEVASFPFLRPRVSMRMLRRASG